MAGKKWSVISVAATFIKPRRRCWKSAKAHFIQSVTLFGTSTSSRSNRSADDCMAAAWPCAGSLMDAGEWRACIIPSWSSSLQVVRLPAVEDARHEFHALVDTRGQINSCYWRFVGNPEVMVRSGFWNNFRIARNLVVVQDR
jgi:hypothetical protein